jgi:histo-blood group ABO system transferase
MNIAIPIIATGKYINFVPELIKGINKYFLPEHKKWIYVFTDFEGKIEGAEKVHQQHRKFPYPTLFRYHIIYNYFHSQQLNFDYYYYIDSDFLIVDYVGEEILGNVVATLHPGFFNKSPDRFELETKFLCRAYVNPNKITQYVCGGFQGGKEYLTLAKKIMSDINIDQKYGIVPVWHDESYWNALLCKYPPDVILSPSYCMPETIRERKVYGLTKIVPKMIAITKQNVKK